VIGRLFAGRKEKTTAPQVSKPEGSLRSKRREADRARTHRNPSAFAARELIETLIEREIQCEHKKRTTKESAHKTMLKL